MPPPQPSLLAPLLLSLLLTLPLTLLLSPSPHKAHENAITLHVKTPHFSLRTTTHPSQSTHRCALIRLNPPTHPRTRISTSCATIFIHILAHTPGNTTLHTSLAAVEYVNSFWDDLRVSYPHGISYVSNDIALHEKWEDVVSDAKHVHFLHALDHTSLSAQYFSLLPSNNTRNVLSKWHNAATHAKTEDGQDVASLNSIRTCKAGDVICQPRALTRFTCSPARMRCDAVWGVVMIRVYAVVLTFIICISYMSTLRRRFSFMRVPNGNALLLCLCFLLAICMGRWTQIVSNICTVIGVHKRHTFTKDISVGDTYFSSPDLTGTWDKFAYVYADGVERIRISGPGVSLVVICVKVVLFVGRGLGDGYMVRCLFWGCVVRMVVSIVGRLNAFGEREEYVEVGAGRKESKGRSFGLPRDRARVQRQV